MSTTATGAAAGARSRIVGKETDSRLAIRPHAVEAYLRTRGFDDAQVMSLRPIGASTQEGLKAYGYGRPLRVTFTSQGKTHDRVIRTMSPDPYGHERRADRAAAMVLARDTFASIPQHIHAMDVGAFDAQGNLVCLPEGEPFLVTDFVEGELYAHDLREMQGLSDARPLDLERAQALAQYLARLHAEQVEPSRYVRALRDTLGSGEGVFGLTDAYPSSDRVAPPERLMHIETELVRWRWELRRRSARARRTHGDFHPFNLLFRAGVDVSILDCSRGGAGEPADDVTCLSVNYLFFALAARDELTGPLRTVWDRFWDAYLVATGDDELLEVVAPFFTWRLLVLASPVWYPNVAADVRDRLLRMAERLLAGERFHPASVDELLR